MVMTATMAAVVVVFVRCEKEEGTRCRMVGERPNVKGKKGWTPVVSSPLYFFLWPMGALTFFCLFYSLRVAPRVWSAFLSHLSQAFVWWARKGDKKKIEKGSAVCRRNTHTGGGRDDANAVSISLFYGKKNKEGERPGARCSETHLFFVFSSFKRPERQDLA